MSKSTIFSEDIVQTENKNFVRDVRSKALLFNDQEKLRQHRTQVRQLKDSQNAVGEINMIKEQMKDIENDVSEIKNLLNVLINNQKKE